jgi:excisionase family DNA binding protein
MFRDRRITDRHGMVMAALYGGEPFDAEGNPRTQYDGRGQKHNRLKELTDLAEWGYAALFDRWELTTAGHDEMLKQPARELPPQQAADYLNISPKGLRALLDAGEIPFRQAGQRCLIREDDLAAYKAKDDAERATVADELTVLGQEMDR